MAGKSSFDKAWPIIKKHEGGYCVDSGGPTNYGVTIPVLEEYYQVTGKGDMDHDETITKNDILLLTEDMAKDIWKLLWWDRYSYGSIENQTIATKIMDISVNVGPYWGHIIAQRALRALGLVVKEDGIFGPVTLKMINGASPLTYMIALRCEAAGYYRLIINKHSRYKQYEAGWLGRAYA